VDDIFKVMTSDEKWVRQWKHDDFDIAVSFDENGKADGKILRLRNLLTGCPFIDNARLQLMLP
jgi:hypothetical protein